MTLQAWVLSAYVCARARGLSPLTLAVPALALSDVHGRCVDSALLSAAGGGAMDPRRMYGHGLGQGYSQVCMILHEMWY